MDKPDKEKEIKKKLLEIERDKKIEEARKDVKNRGLSNSGEYYSVSGPYIEEYELKKNLVDLDVESVPINPSQNESPKERPILFDNHKSRYRYHSKLEKLFRGVIYASYVDIGLFIGIIKQKSQYGKSTKNQILGIKGIFNKKSISIWGEKLKATRNNTADGLTLVPIK